MMTRGQDKKAAGNNPGLLYVNSKITKPNELSPENYTKWYEQVHIPDIFKTSGIKEASRWKNIEPAGERPYLAMYPLEDLDFLQTDEFKAIPVHDEQLPGSHAIFDFADFDTRYYKWVQTYEPKNTKENQPNFVISACFTPADEKDYEDWYRQEHLIEISGISGWRGTQRYELTFARQNRKAAAEKQISDPPKFLTLHFFDGETLPEKELAKAGESEWTKKNMETMKEAKVAIFQKLSQYTK
ncbi:hypothetical protein M433DRAFT_155048 [Acidomyces richmondensis BFW]|nr:MAG: hypothetical protein FE78DRAFT_32654 [Acidomyces sp. 'richmondensis']KYG44938.1 hypothetical protein M433DRAFT_155048 [Acidomyces richmondensis BFW]